MKLLMENWRKFVAETERTKNYGDLYLFENDSIQKVSFYDRFSTLNESDDDFKLFLEQWEKSIDYIFNNLSEQEESNDAILRASTQAYMLLQRGGEEVGKVMNFAKKLKDKGANRQDVMESHADIDARISRKFLKSFNPGKK